MTKRLMCVAVVLAAVFVSASPLRASEAGVAASPLHSAGAQAVYPRLTKFPDAGIMARVNAALAVRETADRAASADCVLQLKEQGGTPDKDTYSVEITVRYLSARYFSIDVTAAYDCGGPYPNTEQRPVTFDLASGRVLAWNTLFKPGFWPSDAAAGRSSVLTWLYRARYADEKGDADCRAAIAGNDPFESAPIARLDAKRGLLVWPDLPHAIQACADALSLSPDDLAPYLKDARLLAELKSVVNPSPGKGPR
jgi:hypothetical protein